MSATLKVSRRPIPAAMQPMLATLVKSAPEGDGWVHEIKYDGYRMLCRVEDGEARIFSRNGKEWTAQLGAIAGELARLRVTNGWFDGELVALDAKGRSDFQVLQNAIASPRAAQLTLILFDVMYVDGEDIRTLPLTGRKKRLHKIVGRGTKHLRVGPEAGGSGAEFLKQACALSLEGAMSKRADSPYRSGERSRDWVKVKCTRRQELVVGGYTDPQGGRAGFGALLLGVYDRGKLRYAGRVGTGFDTRTLDEITAKLKRRERAQPAFADPPRGAMAKGVHWVRPDLVAEVDFTEWSADGALRHPSFKGLRVDKKASEVVRERPVAVKNGRAPAAASSGSVSGIRITHPDKQLFPPDGPTKLELAEYYARVAPVLVPHLVDRPLSLLRCPDGIGEKCFYQKHADKSLDAAVKRVRVKESGGPAQYASAGSAKALAALVQWGVVELHPWGSRVPQLARPDILIMDLDPDDRISWGDLVTAVLALRETFESAGLRAFLKTTGGKGLHVVVPIRATITWAQAKALTRAVADAMVRAAPDRYIATASKSRRTGKIFVDHLRNSEGATAVAPYSVRARAGAPVATPIHWEELNEDRRFDHFNVRNVPERLERQKSDPWRGFAAARRTVTPAVRRRLGIAD
jgi:bifunctional non-homologous end joining protein LigD